MAPPSADIQVEQSSPTVEIPHRASVNQLKSPLKKTAGGLTQSAQFPEPLEYSGSLDNYESFDVTSVIGREFPKLQLTELLADDVKIRDLAILGTCHSFDFHFCDVSAVC